MSVWKGRTSLFYFCTQGRFLLIQKHFFLLFCLLAVLFRTDVYGTLYWMRYCLALKWNRFHFHREEYNDNIFSNTNPKLVDSAKSCVWVPANAEIISAPPGRVLRRSWPNRLQLVFNFYCFQFIWPITDTLKIITIRYCFKHFLLYTFYFSVAIGAASV